jgi:glycosyltransferase involved in cell wall biosynthesis
MKIRSIGRNVYYQPRSVLYHLEGASNGTDETFGVKSYQVRNQPLFRSKWNDVLTREHFSSDSSPYIAKDSGRARAVALVLDNNVPRPDFDAGSRSTWHIIKTLVDQGMIVKFFPHNRHFDEEYSQWLSNAGVEVVGCLEGLSSWLEHSGGVDYAIVNRPHVAEAHLRVLRERTDAKILYYGHDLHFSRLRLQAEVTGDPQFARLAKESEIAEQEIWSEVDAVYYPSHAEVEEVRRRLPSKAAYAIPVFAYESIDKRPRSLSDRNGLLFVGGFNHQPNADGLKWFIDSVMPLLVARFADLTLDIVGSEAPLWLREMTDPHVRFWGRLSDDDLMSRYEAARVAIAPLRYGAGVKGKVVESMARGVPCVTTAVGAQGLSAESALCISDTPEAFANQVLELLTNETLWHRQSLNALEFASANFSNAALWRVLSAEIAPRKDRV